MTMFLFDIITMSLQPLIVNAETTGSSLTIVSDNDWYKILYNCNSALVINNGYRELQQWFYST